MNSSDAFNNGSFSNATNESDLVPEPPISVALKIGMTSAYAIAFVIGFFGNSIGMYVVCHRTGFKMITNLLIANMAFADLLVCIFVMPTSVAHLYVLNRWIPGGFGIFLCKMVNYSFFVSLAASLFTIVSISVERFVAVFFPLRCEFLKRPKLLTVTIWTLGVLVMMPILFLFTVWTDDEGEHYCVLSWPWDDSETLFVLRRFFTFTFVFLYCLPVLFLAGLYALIAMKLWSRDIPGNRTRGNRATSHKCRKKVIKLLVFVVLIFVICWFPSHVMHYYMTYEMETPIPVAVQFVCFFISQANSSINPILYILLNDGFRKDFFRVISDFVSRSRDGCCRVPRVFSQIRSRNNRSRTNSTYTGTSSHRRMSLLQIIQAMRGTLGSAFSPNARGLTTVAEEEQRRKISVLQIRKNQETRF